MIYLDRIRRLSIALKIGLSVRSLIKRIDHHILFFSILFGMMIWFSTHICIDNYDPYIQLRDISAGFASCDFLDAFKLAYYIVVSYIGFYVLYNVIVRAREKDVIRRNESWHFPLICAAIEILIWLPCILTYYPGMIYYDTRISIYMARGVEKLTNHHPVLYTLSWKWIIDLGKILGLSSNSILLVYTSLQCIGMSLAVAYFIYVCYLKGFSKWILIGIMAFYSFFSLIPMYIISLWKDTPFAIVSFVFSTFLYSRASGGRIVLLSFSDKVKYCILSLLFCFTRNNAVYAYQFCIFVYCIIALKHGHFNRTVPDIIGGGCNAYISLSIIIVLVTIVIQGPVFEGMQLNYSTKAESSGVIIQQLANIIVSDGELSQQDIQFVNEIIPIDGMKELYAPFSAYDIKWDETFSYYIFNSQFEHVLLVYMRAIIHNPVQAIYSYALATEGFWDITRQLNIGGYVCDYMKPTDNGEFRVDQIKKWTGVSLEEFYKPDYLFSSALFAWMILFSFVIGIKERKSTVLALLPSIGIWITLLVATPVAYMMRYAFCLVLTMPIGIAILFEYE